MGPVGNAFPDGSLTGARTAFQPDGPRHLQDVYFDVDDVSNELARITGEAEINMAAAAH